MKIILSIIVSLFLFCSCVTEKQRARICNSCASVSLKKDSIVYKIDSVKVEIPGKDGPIVYLENPCQNLCDSLGRLKNVNIITKKNGQIVKINTQGNGINISTHTKDTAIKAPVIKKESYSRQKDVEVKYEVCKRDHKTSFDGFCNWFFYIVGPLIGFYIFFRVKKLIP